MASVAALEPWQRLGITPEQLLEGIGKEVGRVCLVACRRGAEGAALFFPNNALAYMESRGVAGPLLISYEGETLVPAPVAYISALAVFPGAQGAGVGRHLLQACEQACLAAGAKQVCLCVSKWNVRAQEFYRRNGYAEVGRIPDFLVAGNTEMLMIKNLA